MLESLVFYVVEDNDGDASEVYNQLADAGFSPENNKGRAITYEDAKTALEEHSQNLDVLFLDLNLPRNLTDGKQEKGHGKALLDLIHKELNMRAGVDIKVIVVSGEPIHDGMQDALLMEAYKGTLFGIVKKAELPNMLNASLKRLKKDPLRSRIKKNNLEVINEYDVVNDTNMPIKERLKSARTIAIKLLQNETDHYRQKLNCCVDFSDDLGKLIDIYVKSRFNGYIKASTITSPTTWDSFVWRGTLIQHCYTINNYRNIFEHLIEHPFRSLDGHSNSWNIPNELITSLESGASVAQIAELIVKDLLEWYLPWHEQVYVPWRAQLPGV